MLKTTNIEADMMAKRREREYCDRALDWEGEYYRGIWWGPPLYYHAGNIVMKAGLTLGNTSLLDELLTSPLMTFLLGWRGRRLTHSSASRAGKR